MPVNSGNLNARAVLERRLSRDQVPKDGYGHPINPNNWVVIRQLVWVQVQPVAAQTVIAAMQEATQLDCYIVLRDDGRELNPRAQDRFYLPDEDMWYMIDGITPVPQDRKLRCRCYAWQDKVGY